MREIENIELFYWCTPNGDKVLILLEELGIPYTLKPINILRGDQHEETFLTVSPNNKIPAVTIHYKDSDNPNEEQANKSLTLFESGAILLHLAEHFQQLLGQDKPVTLQWLFWLFWQVGGLGPMAGQTHHFRKYAPEVVPYAKARYEKETRRLYQVLEKQLNHQDYISGEYSIADIACYPWVTHYEAQGIELVDFPNITRWLSRIALRQTVQKAAEINEQVGADITFDETARQHLFK